MRGASRASPSAIPNRHTKDNGKKAAKPRLLPKMARTPIGERKKRARQINSSVSRVITEEMADACFDKFSRMRLTEKSEPDITKSLSKSLAHLSLDEVVRKRPLFKLMDVLPKAGMLYHKYGGDRLMSHRYKHDNQIVQALWEGMPDVGERKRTQRSKFFKFWTEQFIFPVFDHAKQLIEKGHLPAVADCEGYDCEGYDEESEARNAFDKLIRNLHMHSNMQWVRTLSLERFSAFFSILATARDEEILFPKHDGQPLGLLANSINGFLEEAARADIPWRLAW